MSAVYGGILCAGFGTRMSPITDVLPKPLIPFLNTPTIAYAMNHLARAGVADFACNLYHLADSIPPVVDKLAEAFNMRPVYAREWQILGTAGGIRGIWEALGKPTGTLVILNGDSIMNIDLAQHIQAHQRSGAKVSLVVRAKDSSQPGRVWLDAAGRLVGVRDHRAPSAPAPEGLIEHDFVGVHLIDSSVIETLPLEEGDIITACYGPMLERGEMIGASIMDGFWAALDNPKLYLDNQRRCLDEPGLFEQAPLPEPLADGMFFYRPGAVADGARVAGPVFAGINVGVDAGAKVGPNVVLDGVDVAGDAVISNAVMYGMGRVEGEWRDCVAIAGKIASLSSE